MSESLAPGRLPQQSLAETALAWLQRLLALCCLAFGVVYWGRIVGFHDAPLWRFDWMPVHWQVASVALAALFPFAAIGLWMLASWGPAIWLICAGSEAAMFALYPPLFAESRLVIASHLAALILYAALRLLIFVQKRRAGVSGY